MQPHTCPRCGHHRPPHETQVHPGVCPACGIAYAKWRPPDESAPRTAAPAPSADDEGLGQRLRVQLALLPEDADATGLAWRALLLAGLGAWTLWFGAKGVDWEAIGGSVLHPANLAFHEFGHVAFRPFGAFMTVLGGSVFQVLLPVALAAYFSLWRADNVAAAVALWWSGQNLVDVAPYIADAEYRLLPLVGGGGEESHDWGNILTALDAVDRCHSLARASFVAGIAVMCAALAWGGWLLLRWRTGLRR